MVTINVNLTILVLGYCPTQNPIFTKLNSRSEQTETKMYPLNTAQNYPCYILFLFFIEFIQSDVGQDIFDKTIVENSFVIHENAIHRSD